MMASTIFLVEKIKLLEASIAALETYQTATEERLKYHEGLLDCAEKGTIREISRLKANLDIQSVHQSLDNMYQRTSAQIEHKLTFPYFEYLHTAEVCGIRNTLAFLHENIHTASVQLEKAQDELNDLTGVEECKEND